MDMNFGEILFNTLQVTQGNVGLLTQINGLPYPLEKAVIWEDTCRFKLKF